VRRDLVASPARHPVDRVLERRVLEGFDLPAGVADEVVMVLAAGVGALVA
jgi:hypothetical protein